jgi:hypothetical protein
MSPNLPEADIFWPHEKLYSTSEASDLSTLCIDTRDISSCQLKSQNKLKIQIVEA